MVSSLTNESGADKVEESQSWNQIKGQVNGFRGISVAREANEAGANADDGQQREEQVSEYNRVQWIDRFSGAVELIVRLWWIVKYSVPVRKPIRTTSHHVKRCKRTGVTRQREYGGQYYFEDSAQMQNNRIARQLRVERSQSTYRSIDDDELTYQLNKTNEE